MPKKKKEEVVGGIVKIIKTEIIKVNGEDKIKVDYEDGSVAYRSL